MGRKKQVFEFAWCTLLVFMFTTGFWFAAGNFLGFRDGERIVDINQIVTTAIFLGCICTFFGMLEILKNIQKKLNKVSLS